MEAGLTRSSSIGI